jgi:hypothetical protein
MEKIARKISSSFLAGMTNCQALERCKVSLNKISPVAHPILLDGLIAKSSMEYEKKLSRGAWKSLLN